MDLVFVPEDDACRGLASRRRGRKGLDKLLNADTKQRHRYHQRTYRERQARKRVLMEERSKLRAQGLNRSLASCRQEAESLFELLQKVLQWLEASGINIPAELGHELGNIRLNASQLEPDDTNETTIVGANDARSSVSEASEQSSRPGSLSLSGSDEPPFKDPVTLAAEALLSARLTQSSQLRPIPRKVAFDYIYMQYMKQMTNPDRPHPCPQLIPTPIEAAFVEKGVIYPKLKSMAYPPMRERILLFKDLFDTDDFFERLPGKMICWGQDPAQMESWEFPDFFFVDYPFLIDERMVSGTNRWRVERGLAPLTDVQPMFRV